MALSDFRVILAKVILAQAILAKVIFGVMHFASRMLYALAILGIAGKVC